MSEIIRDTRKHTIMPGLNTRTGDLKAYNLQHTFIAGKLSDTNTLLDSILCHMIQFNTPDRMSIEYFSYESGLDTWRFSSTNIPHFRNQLYVPTSKKVWDRLEQILQLSLSKMSSDVENEFKKCSTVIVLNELNALLGDNIEEIEYRLNLLNALLENGERIGLTIIAVANRRDEYINSLIGYFKLIMTTSISKEWCMDIMKYDISSDMLNNRLKVWVKEDCESYSIRRFDIKHYNFRFLRNLNTLYGLSYNKHVWEELNNFDCFDNMSESKIYLMLKNVYHDVPISFPKMEKKYLIRLYVKSLCYINSIGDKKLLLETLHNVITANCEGDSVDEKRV